MNAVAYKLQLLLGQIRAPLNIMRALILYRLIAHSKSSVPCI